MQGCDDDTGYLKIDDDPTKIDINLLGKIGHAQSVENSDLPSMGQDSLLRSQTEKYGITPPQSILSEGKRDLDEQVVAE